MQRLEENSSASVRDRTPAVQPIDRHYTDSAIPALTVIIIITLNLNNKIENS
jgi:hypothetical protein